MTSEAKTNNAGRCRTLRGGAREGGAHVGRIVEKIGKERTDLMREEQQILKSIAKRNTKRSE
jgi:hypothetical protein